DHGAGGAERATRTDRLAELLEHRPVLWALEPAPAADDDRRLAHIGPGARGGYELTDPEPCRLGRCDVAQRLDGAGLGVLLRAEGVGAERDQPRRAVQLHTREDLSRVEWTGDDQLAAIDRERGGIGREREVEPRRETRGQVLAPSSRGEEDGEVLFATDHARQHRGVRLRTVLRPLLALRDQDTVGAVAAELTGGASDPGGAEDDDVDRGTYCVREPARLADHLVGSPAERAITLFCNS